MLLEFELIIPHTDLALCARRVRRSCLRAADGGGDEEPSQPGARQQELPQVSQALHAREIVIGLLSQNTVLNMEYVMNFNMPIQYLQCFKRRDILFKLVLS